MHYIPLLFLCAKVFSFIYHRELALFLHNFRAIVEARRSTKGANVLKYLFGGDFIAYNDKKQIITYEKYFHQTI